MSKKNGTDNRNPRLRVDFDWDIVWFVLGSALSIVLTTVIHTTATEIVGILVWAALVVRLFRPTDPDSDI